MRSRQVVIGSASVSAVDALGLGLGYTATENRRMRIAFIPVIAILLALVPTTAGTGTEATSGVFGFGGKQCRNWTDDWNNGDDERLDLAKQWVFGYLTGRGVRGFGGSGNRFAPKTVRTLWTIITINCGPHPDAAFATIVEDIVRDIKNGSR